jgi:biopolymer transport protein TolR
MNSIPDQLVLVVDRSRSVLMNGSRIPGGTLRARLAAIAKAKPEVQVFIQGDKSVPYGFIAQVMAEVKQAKITRIGLVTEPGDPNARM